MKSWKDYVNESNNEMNTLIKDTLEFIKDQIGLKLKLDDAFGGGIKKLHGKKYFNIILSQRTAESREYEQLKMFANKYGSIRIEPNGLKRVSIFPIKINKNVIK